MRRALFNRIKAGNKGGRAGQWSARKAQMLAKQYKAKGGGYRYGTCKVTKVASCMDETKWRTKRQALLKGQKLPLNVIYLKKQLRLFLPVNTPRLRLQNAEQLEKVNKYLNNPSRLLRKRKAIESLHRR